MNIQRLLDELLARFPNISNFVGWVKYVPQGQPVPDDTTHTFKFANTQGADIVVAVRIDQPYASIVDLILRAL